MANNYQAYMQRQNPQPFNNQLSQPNNQNYDWSQQQNNQQQYQQQFVPSLGFKEVDGLAGYNRYPIAPGASVPLKDVNSMTLFIKSADLTGSLLPIRVFKLEEITQEYQDRETPVSRAEFNQLSMSLAELSKSTASVKQMLEDLTSPSSSD